jgi:hypothetical protein
MSDNLKLVRDRILSEFADVPYPGDDKIANRNPGFLAYEDYEGRAVEAFFRGKRWQDVTLQSLEEGYDGDKSACLSFMTVNAFRYYLPAYMLICIDDYEGADVSYTATLQTLTPQIGDVEIDARTLTRISGFTQQQKQTIALFLKEMSALHGADDPWDDTLVALDSYWKQYL